MAAVDLSPEVRWVVQCLRSRYASEPAETGPFGDLDWPTAMRTVRRNAVLPLVNASIAGGLATVPDDVRMAIEEEARVIQMRNLASMGVLLGALEALHAAGLRALPYKGPILAQVAYGDLGLRAFGDLDVMVDRRNVADALFALEGIGFRGEVLSPRRTRVLVDAGHDWPTWDAAGNLIEVQWAISSRAHSRPRGVEALLDRATTVSVAGRDVPTLNPTDQVVVLAIHGGIHLWARLAWVCDMAQALALPGVDEERVGRLAAGAGAHRMLLLAVGLVDRVLDYRPIPTLASEAAADRAVQRLADSLERSLLARGGPDIGLASERVRTRVSLSDTRVQGWIGAARAIFTPTPSDWASVSLPDALLPLYYPIRLARVATFALGRRPHADGFDVFDTH